MYVKTLLIACAVVFTTGCVKNETDSEKKIVARVGERTITAKDFRQNYEFGFAHLKTGKNKKRSYLEKMIREKLLALEGYRLNLDETERVQNREKELLDELLVEELFHKEVDEKINISAQEIKDAISKSNVAFKLRYWIEPSLAKAREVNELMQEKGFTTVAKKILEKNREIKYSIKNFETGYLTWLDIPQELLKEVKNLEISAISGPILFNGKYLTLQVLDIKRGILSDYDYNRTYTQVKKILYSRKIQEETARYISRLMTPKNVVTKANAFNMLVQALAEWKKEKSVSSNKGAFRNAIEQASKNKPALQKLKQNLNKILITFKNGNLTLDDFIAHFDPASVKSNPSDIGRFKQELNHQIAMYVRNSFLVKEALKKGLDNSTAVTKELNAWRDKWVYEETRRYLLRDVKTTKNKQQNNYLLKGRKILAKKIELLRNEYPVTIDEKLLSEIEVTDFSKSRWANLMLYKSGSGRPAVPVVDPTWTF